MSLSKLRAAAPGDDQGVTMLELFFDLVFVFTVTQLTDVVRHADSATGYLHAAAILLLTWWMYDGYAWLSNNVGPTTLSTQLPMLVGIAAALVVVVVVAVVTRRQPPAAASARTRADLRREDARA